MLLLLLLATDDSMTERKGAWIFARVEIINWCKNSHTHIVSYRLHPKLIWVKELLMILLYIKISMKYFHRLKLTWILYTHTHTHFMQSNQLCCEKILQITFFALAIFSICYYMQEVNRERASERARMAWIREEELLLIFIPVNGSRNIWLFL